MKILTGAQIRELDKYTIEHEPISSVDLMERSAKAITNAICERWAQSTPIVVFAGPGNNGGDALAMSRLLAEKGYVVDVFLFNIHNHLSEECAKNRDRLVSEGLAHKLTEITSNFEPPQLTEKTLVVDGLFGSGLKEPLSGGFASLVSYINQSPAQVVSIDIPSGLMTENNRPPDNPAVVRANIDTIPATYDTVDPSYIKSQMLKRDDFAHKGSMGNALLIAGSRGMAGAAILASKACMRSGAGKVTALTPHCNLGIMQMAVPEAVCIVDRESYYSEAIDTDGFQAVGIGPGLGKEESSALALMSQLQQTSCPIVLDADALNMLGSHGTWVQQLPNNVIMTPHPREFDRITGRRNCSDYERLMLARDMARDLCAYIILKGHYSALCLPDGGILFNTTGNSGMATAGSGDVLTGIITALLARGYSRKNACLVGMYLHGLAGDIAAERTGKESLIASDIIDSLPEAFKNLEK